MSNIKVRAWDAKNNEMLDDMEAKIWLSKGFDRYPNRVKFMLSTGLRDQTLNEIYDRDIIRTDGGVVLEVRWHNESASFVAVSNGSAHIHYFGRGINTDYVEVIGNSFENPELLKYDI
jgi:hypothetical protein